MHYELVSALECTERAILRQKQQQILKMQEHRLQA